MIQPPIPEDDALRVASLHQLKLLDTPAEERFDRITRIARRLFGVPISAINLVDADRIWSKSKLGDPMYEVPRKLGFCAYTIAGDERFIVADAAADPRFADNPLVASPGGLRFYAGQPLHAPDGQTIGTLAIMDRQPREISASDLAVLADLAALVESEMQLDRLSHAQVELIEALAHAQRQALIDPLTRLWNRGAIVPLLEREWLQARQSGAALSVIMADVDHFKAINDTYGHPVGDQALQATTAILRNATRTADSVGRYGGEEFLILLTGCTLPNALHVAEKIRRQVAATPIETPLGSLALTLSLGIASTDALPHATAEELIQAADQALLRAKQAGRNQVQAVDGAPRSQAVGV